MVAAALPVALDVGVTDPGKQGAVHHGSWKVPDGALKAAEVYTNEKRVRFEKVKALNPVLGFGYRPIVFDTSSIRLRFYIKCFFCLMCVYMYLCAYCG